MRLLKLKPVDGGRAVLWAWPITYTEVTRHLKTNTSAITCTEVSTRRPLNYAYFHRCIIVLSIFTICRGSDELIAVCHDFSLPDDVIIGCLIGKHCTR